MPIVSRVPAGNDNGPDVVVTWHHGLIARWWAMFNIDGPEIEFFRPIVAAGQPALDAACGTGRLLVPWVVDGLDVDGVDASADMIAGCRDAAGPRRAEPGPVRAATAPPRPPAPVRRDRRLRRVRARRDPGAGPGRPAPAVRPPPPRRSARAGLRGRAVRHRTVAGLAAASRRRVPAGTAGSTHRPRRLRVRAPAPRRGRGRRHPTGDPRAPGLAVARRRARRPPDPPPPRQRLLLDGDRRRAGCRRLRRHSCGRRLSR